MTAILGIDAAWTASNGSGIALLARDDRAWRWRAVAPDQERYVARAHGRLVTWELRRETRELDVDALLDASKLLLRGGEVDVVAIDMPISTQPINGRRQADEEVSREFGARKCSVHSPTPQRPGSLGARLTVAFGRRGFPIATARGGGGRALIEVYPHVALLELLRCGERFKYKVSRSAKFWPGKISVRVGALRGAFATILNALEGETSAVPFELPRADAAARITHLKPYEDGIDAMICAWMGRRFLEGRARPVGDDAAAIWVPA